MTNYLNESQIIEINKAIINRYSPNEKIALLNSASLNMIVNLPEQYVFGKELYPTIYDKATIIFMQLVLKHVFANANKRTAYFTLIKFLRLNDFRFISSSEQAIEKTVEVATLSFNNNNFIHLKKWIKSNSI